jgi:heterodisulfide reductase subunit C
MTIELPPEKNPKDLFERLRTLCGQDYRTCYQCGSCTSSCPMVEHMDASPRKVCSTCVNCGVVCPRGIDVPKVLESLRLLTLRKNQDYIEPVPEYVAKVRNYPQIAIIAGFRKMTS